MQVPNSKNGVSLRAYPGDAMTLLAFDLDESKTKDFAGFSVRITPGPRKRYYLTNLLTYPTAILKKNNIEPERAHSTFFSPIQKFRWVHVPSERIIATAMGLELRRNRQTVPRILS